jgi:hypothetical protein
MQRAGATYYILDQRLEPRALHQATLHRTGQRGSGGVGESVKGARETSRET